MRQKKIVKTVTATFCALFVGWLIYLNYDNKNFACMSLNDILTLLLLVYVSYFLVEKKSDERILNEKIESTLSIISMELGKINSSLFSDNFEPKNYTVISKRISTRIKLLRYYEKKKMISEEVEYIDTVFKEIDIMIGNHISEISELTTILVDIDNKIDNIQVRMDTIFTKLY